MTSAVNSTGLVLNVRRNEPELVSPARPTPHDLKPLSDIDNLHYLRFQVPIILAYPAADETKHGKDPAKVIKEALGEALVYYYPWAGRLREGPGGKLLVDCTAEGVVFVEADADVRLDQFGEELLVPPFPCTEELFYKEASSNTVAVVGSPMFTIQVTRLLCGGFIAAFHFSHVMSDAIGVVKFLNTVAELGRGASTPSILPVWKRDLLLARDPPRVTCTLPGLHEKDQDYQDQDSQDQDQQLPNIFMMDNLVSRPFIFGDSEVAALRAIVPHPCTTFELISACIWRCRTIALQYPPEKEVRLGFAVNFRNKFDPPFPAGYYGNASVGGICISPAGDICNRSFEYTVELVKKAKAAVTEDYTKSFIDLMVLRGHNMIPVNPDTYNLSEVSSSMEGFPILDFGWGKPVYAGPPDNGFAAPILSFLLGYGNGKGKVLSVSLPGDVMDRFVSELGSLLKVDLPL